MFHSGLRSQANSAGTQTESALAIHTSRGALIKGGYRYQLDSIKGIRVGTWASDTERPVSPTLHTTVISMELKNILDLPVELLTDLTSWLSDDDDRLAWRSACKDLYGCNKHLMPSRIGYDKARSAYDSLTDHSNIRAPVRLKRPLRQACQDFSANPSGRDVLGAIGGGYQSSPKSSFGTDQGCDIRMASNVPEPPMAGTRRPTRRPLPFRLAS